MRSHELRRSLIPCLIVPAGIAVAAGARPAPASPAGIGTYGAQPQAHPPARPAAIGRWDLTVQEPKGPHPSWAR